MIEEINTGLALEQAFSTPCAVVAGPRRSCVVNITLINKIDYTNLALPCLDSLEGTFEKNKVKGQNAPF
jgi:hypothetical protein